MQHCNDLWTGVGGLHCGWLIQITLTSKEQQSSTSEYPTNIINPIDEQAPPDHGAGAVTATKTQPTHHHGATRP